MTVADEASGKTTPLLVAVRKNGKQTRYMTAAKTQTKPGKLPRLAKKIRLTVNGAKLETQFDKPPTRPTNTPCVAACQSKSAKGQSPAPSS